MRIVALLLAALITAKPTAGYSDQCRLALVLALDVSGSVNETEYAQQLNGLAYALDSPDVRSAILTGASAPVLISVFEWSSRNHQFIVLPWIALDNHADIDQAVGKILEYKKKRAGLKTALSTAMLFASDLLREKGHCWQRTIDVSGDGKNNIGPSLAQVYNSGLFAGVTINALVVGDPTPDRDVQTSEAVSRNDLKLYYEQNVIRGRGAFAMIAYGYEDYERSMKKKLLRELALPVMGAKDP